MSTPSEKRAAKERLRSVRWALDSIASNLAHDNTVLSYGTAVAINNALRAGASLFRDIEILYPESTKKREMRIDKKAFLKS